MKDNGPRKNNICPHFFNFDLCFEICILPYSAKDNISFLSVMEIERRAEWNWSLGWQDGNMGQNVKNCWLLRKHFLPKMSKYRSN